MRPPSVTTSRIWLAVTITAGILRIRHHGFNPIQDYQHAVELLKPLVDGSGSAPEQTATGPDVVPEPATRAGTGPG